MVLSWSGGAALALLDRYLIWLRETILPLPAACYWCGVAVGRPLCALCKSALVIIPPHRCSRCWRALRCAPGSRPPGRCYGCRVAPPAYTGVVAVSLYQGLGRWTVHAVKGQGEQFLLEPLAGLLADRLGQDRVNVDAVVPIPTDPRRARRRGFDQAEALAERVAVRLGRPCLTGVLQRRGGRPPQSSLKGVARRRNAATLFKVRRGKSPAIRGIRILLVDDVISTGSSLHHAALALLRAGAAEVWAGVIADNAAVGG